MGKQNDEVLEIVQLEEIDLSEDEETTEEENTVDEEAQFDDVESVEVVGAPIEEPTHEVVEQKENAWKFYCESCSNYAFFSSYKSVFDTVPCANCGRTVTYKEENYLPA